MWKNISNQLVTKNQYQVMVHSCSICLYCPKLSWIVLQFFRKIIFWKIFYYYFEFQKNHFWKNKTSDWNCRTHKLKSRESTNTFDIMYCFHTINFLRNFDKNLIKKVGLWRCFFLKMSTKKRFAIPTLDGRSHVI